MEIKVYGPGCAKCKTTEDLVRSTVDELGVKAKVTKVSGMAEMMGAGVMSTPAVSVNGVIKSTGKVPTKAEIKTWLAS